MLVFVKLGGSLITNKQEVNSFRPSEVGRLAREIGAALDSRPDLQLLIGHGSGSFGHMAAKRYGTMQGVRTPEQWRGYAEVANVASELNFLMSEALESAGVPVIRIQPSASAHCHDGAIIDMAVQPVAAALEHGLVPLVHGDVALDDVRGGTIISTESVFFFLAQHLPVDEVLLLGEVEGVYDREKRVIPEITPNNLASVEAVLGGSAGTDVTGGMETKVRDMAALVQQRPHMRIQIMSGMTSGLLACALNGEAVVSTVIRADR
jgi:isopentenyl phosphate kinase